MSKDKKVLKQVIDGGVGSLSKEFFLNDDSAKAFEIKRDSDYKAHQYDSGLRIYKSSPNAATIQIRTFAPMSNGGKDRCIVTTMTYLRAEEIDHIIAALQTIKKEIAK